MSEHPAADHAHHSHRQHSHPHEHGHPHAPHGPHEDSEPHAHHESQEHEHGPEGGRGAAWGRLRHQLSHLVKPHSHDASAKVDRAMETSAQGMRTLWSSLAGLGTTAVLQAIVVVLSGSVALLGDSIHNAADALTAVPLGIAFVAGRRAATRRFTYGFGRAEDLAGIAIVTLIALSAALAAAAAVDRLLHPARVTYLPWVAGAAVIGFIGNEWVARYRIRVGRTIGSAALVADGLHARTDGFTSLAVLVGAAGVALGFPLADPIVGLVITVAILAVLRTAVRDVFRRLIDGVDPATVDIAERTLGAQPGVRAVRSVRMRWVGHRLHADAELDIEPD